MTSEEKNVSISTATTGSGALLHFQHFSSFSESFWLKNPSLFRQGQESERELREKVKFFRPGGL